VPATANINCGTAPNQTITLDAFRNISKSATAGTPFPILPIFGFTIPITSPTISSPASLLSDPWSVSAGMLIAFLQEL
jgi:hypothetical protein